jgi:hypothetical protein
MFRPNQENQEPSYLGQYIVHAAGYDQRTGVLLLVNTVITFTVACRRVRGFTQCIRGSRPPVLKRPRREVHGSRTSRAEELYLHVVMLNEVKRQP